MCVSPCSTPGGGPSFHLGECEMELGLGVYVVQFSIASALVT